MRLLKCITAVQCLFYLSIILLSSCSKKIALYTPLGEKLLSESYEVKYTPQWKSKKHPTVLPADYYKWLASFEKVSNKAASKSAGKKITFNWILSRENQIGDLFLLTSANFNNIWLKEFNFGKIKMDFLRTKSFSAVEESIQLVSINEKKRNYNTDIFKSFNNEKFCSIVGNSLEDASVPKSNINGNYYFQYYNAKGNSAFPTHFYAGEYANSLPNGYGYLNFFPKDFHSNVIYRGKFENGNFQDLQMAETLFDEAINTLIPEK